MFVGEVGEGIVLVDDSADDLAGGEVTAAGDGDDIAFLCGGDWLAVRAFPIAVVDFVGGGEALILLSELLVDFDTGHGFGVSKVGLPGLVYRLVNF